ncbi:MAG: 2Fe-2S iron-sulfur cluster binding domain-containing protein [Candidatus Sericytochromatia bacterium]|nr:2Fe-2S iron-sulfur cluster binding domain-containing protein [Candidatus Sericytochromatia bacterium]
MKKVNLQPINEYVDIKTEAELLQVLLAKKLNVLMACKGRGLCATCHVYIKEGHDNLTPITSIEQRRLEVISAVNIKNSRLACQARVIGEGVVVELPEGMYLESINDLEKMVGRRTEIDVLSPVTGAVLIQKGKLITRTKVQELSNLNFDVIDIQSNSKTV